MADKSERDLSIWQPVLFIIVLGLSIYFGLYWHDEAHASGVPKVGYGMSLYLYETDATDTMDVSATVRSNQFDIDTPYVYDDVSVVISAAKPIHVLLATEEPYMYDGYQTQPMALSDMGGDVYYLMFNVGGTDGSKAIDFHPPTTVSLSNSGHSTRRCRRSTSWATHRS